MVIFVQATALRYDPYLDFECKLPHTSPFAPVLSPIDLITASIYWSMLEVGLGFIAANLIVIYGLMANTWFKSCVHSLRSLLSVSKFSRLSSHERDATFQTEKDRVWPNTSQSETYVESAGRDIEEMPMNSNEIHATHEFGTTVV